MHVRLHFLGVEHGKRGHEAILMLLWTTERALFKCAPQLRRLKERIVSLKAIRDCAQADGARAAVMLEASGQQAITPQMDQRFARTAREDQDRWRRLLPRPSPRARPARRGRRPRGPHHRLEKQPAPTLTAAAGAKSATPDPRSPVLNWRRGCLPISNLPGSSLIYRSPKDRDAGWVFSLSRPVIV